MSYQSGKMGVAAGISLVILITSPFIFLSTPAQTLEIGKGLAWGIPLIAGVPAAVMLLAMLGIMDKVSGDFCTVCEKLVGRFGAVIIMLYYIGLFFCDAVLLLRQFAENTLLTALPRTEFTYVIVIYMIVVATMTYMGLAGILRTNYAIMPFGILGLLMVLVLLIPFYNVYHLLPWQGAGLGKVITAGLLGAGAQAGVFSLVILAPFFQNLKTIRTAMLFGLSMSIILKTLVVLGFLLAFSTLAGREKVLPFFEMARLVYLSRYLQRIESLFILQWVIVGVSAIALNFYLGNYLISRLFNLPTIRPLIPIVSIIVAEIAILPPDITTVIVLDEVIITSYFNLGIYVIPPILIAAAILKRRKKGVNRCAG